MGISNTLLSPYKACVQKGELTEGTAFPGEGTAFPGEGTRFPNGSLANFLREPRSRERGNRVPWRSRERGNPG